MGSGGSISASLKVIDDGIFDISTAGANGSIKSLKGAGKVILGSNTLTLSNADETDVFSGNISGAGGLTVNGIEAFAGTNAYTGKTTINDSATLSLLSSDSIATSSNVVNNGTLILSAAIDTFPIVISGTGNLIVNGDETLTNANTYNGTTTINSGANLTLEGSGSIANSTVSVTDSGTFNIRTNSSIPSLSGSGNVSLVDKTLILSSATDTFSGNISGTGNFTVNGAEILTGENTYNGTTTINSSANLTLEGSGSIENSRVVDNGTFNITAISADSSSITSLGGSGNVILGDKTLNLTSANDTFSGNISGAGKLIIDDGTEVLNGTNAYTGNTTISNGANLTLGPSGSIENSSVQDNGGDFSINADSSIKSLNGSGFVYLNGKTLTLSDVHSTGTFSGVIADSDSIDYAGVSLSIMNNETLTGKNTYTGNTTINEGGYLSLSGNGSIENSRIIRNHGTLDLSNSTINIVEFETYEQYNSGKLIMNAITNVTQPFTEVNVAGGATLNGTLTVNDDPKRTYTTTEFYPLLTAAFGISGNFSDFSTNIDSRLYETKLIYVHFNYDENGKIYNTEDCTDGEDCSATLEIIPIPEPPPDPSYTSQSVLQNAPGLSTAINIQSAAIQTALSYDCNKFDEYGICVSVGGRYARANAGSSNNKNQAGFVVVGYSPVKKVRFGIFADQSFNTSISPTITGGNTISPMFGFFGHLNLNEDGNGLGLHASAAFANNTFSISRVGKFVNAADYNEAGQGNANMRSQGYQIHASYTQPIIDSIKAIPFVGLRYTHIENGAYTENSSDSVKYPLSYGAMTQNTIAALAALGVSAQITKKLSGFAAIGTQQNLNYKMDNYAGTSKIPNLSNFSIQMPNSRKTLALASAGLFYDIREVGLLGLKVSWQQQAFVNTSTTTVLATYTLKI